MTGISTGETAQRFTQFADDYLKSSFEFMPLIGSGLGLHEYDGRTPNLSKEAIDRRVAQIRQALDELAGKNRDDLDADMRLDYDLLPQGISSDLFRLPSSAST